MLVLTLCFMVNQAQVRFFSFLFICFSLKFFILGKTEFGKKIAVILGCLKLIKKPSQDDYNQLNARIGDYLKKAGEGGNATPSEKLKVDEEVNAKKLRYIDPLRDGEK